MRKSRARNKAKRAVVNRAKNKRIKAKKLQKKSKGGINEKKHY
ncbi:MAG: hypothetical protein WCL02_03745 [bacterium]